MRVVPSAALSPNGPDQQASQDVGVYGSIAALAQKGLLDPPTADMAFGNGFAFAIVPYDVDRNPSHPIFFRTLDDIAEEYRSRKPHVLYAENGDLYVSASRLVFISSSTNPIAISSSTGTPAGQNVPLVSRTTSPSNKNFGGIKAFSAATLLGLAGIFIFLFIFWSNICDDKCQLRIAESCAALTNSYGRNGPEFDRCMRRNNLDPVEWRATQSRVEDLRRSIGEREARNNARDAWMARLRECYGPPPGTFFERLFMAPATERRELETLARKWRDQAPGGPPPSSRPPTCRVDPDGPERPI